MRVAVELESIAAALSNGSQDKLRQALIEVYSRAYREGFSDGKEIGLAEGLDICREEQEHNECLN